MEQEKRRCGSCTKCCEGWLEGNAHGHHFFSGRPCFFLREGGCSIYKDRPEDPCKKYKCMWLWDETIPNWMKPDAINAIITEKTKDGIKYIQVVEAGETLRSDVLSWLMMHAINKGLNMQYFIKGGNNRLGSKEFLEMKF